MGLLKQLRLASGNTKSERIFENLFPGKTFFDIEYKTPSEYVRTYWDKYINSEVYAEGNNSMNGKIFELIISTLFFRVNLLPMYQQAKVAFVPNADYDIIFYNKALGPISISLKTSMRERIKQADLEAIALKYVHRKAKAYLISLYDTEVKRAKANLKEGFLLGLDDIVLATDSEFDELVNQLKNIEMTLAGNVDVITCNLVTTPELKAQYENIRK